MDRKGSLLGGMGAYAPTYGSLDPGMNVPVSSNQNLQSISPYLNFDPSYLTSQQPEFIFPEGASRQRGRFELAFSQIGGSVICGAGVGGTTGLYMGLRETALAGHTGKLRRTQLLNYIGKQGGVYGNSVGVLALMYSGFGVLYSWLRGVDDEFNTLAAGTSTGLLYKSAAGFRKCGAGGAVGFGIAAAYCLWSSRGNLSDFKRAAVI